MVSACLGRAGQVYMLWTPIKQCHLTEPRKPSFSVMASVMRSLQKFLWPPSPGHTTSPENLDIFPEFGG